MLGKDRIVVNGIIYQADVNVLTDDWRERWEERWEER